MRTYRLTREQLVPLDIDEVFAFFADAHNLEQLTPPWLHFEVLTPGPVVMRAGAIIDYGLRLHGVPVGWRSAITVWHHHTGSSIVRFAALTGSGCTRTRSSP